MDAKSLAKYRKVLLEEKQRILNNSKNSLENELVVSTDDLPDETDLAATEVNQNLMFKLRDRERNLLVKIEEALMRIENGSFGICEETEEPIEPARLMAVPWTNLSLEGAEIREARNKQFHKSNRSA